MMDVTKPILILPEDMTFTEVKKTWKEALEKEDTLEIVLRRGVEPQNYWHCLYCGSVLEEAPEENEDWSEFCNTYEKSHGTKGFLCTNKDCTFSESPLVLCHTVRGWQWPAGDSFALAYVK